MPLKFVQERNLTIEITKNATYPTGPGLPLEVSSTLNLKEPIEGGEHLSHFLSSEETQDKQASQL